MSGFRVWCPRCSVPIELPAQQVTPGRHILSTEPLFDHIAQQHRATDVTLTGAAPGQHPTNIVDQCELTKTPDGT